MAERYDPVAACGPQGIDRRDFREREGEAVQSCGRGVSVLVSTYRRLPMPASGSILGNAVRRLEDPALLTGAGKYVDDLVEPNMAHIAFVRSTVAHANIGSVDVTEALSMPGVLAGTISISRHCSSSRRCRRR
jgi:hypothetical protein